MHFHKGKRETALSLSPKRKFGVAGFHTQIFDKFILASKKEWKEGHGIWHYFCSFAVWLTNFPSPLSILYSQAKIAYKLAKNPYHYNSNRNLPENQEAEDEGSTNGDY